jgi:acetyl esterase/lipase
MRVIRHFRLFGSITLALATTAAIADESVKIDRDIEYCKLGDESLRCDVCVPPGAGPFPGVLLVHGGAWVGGRKENMTRIAEKLAEHGYSSATINYRLAPRHTFPAQIEDCKTAVRWMRSEKARLKLDRDHVAGFGYSAGGQLVALLATTDKDSGLEGADVPADAPSTRLQCVVAGGAPCDFRIFPAANRRLAYWLGGSREEKPENYALASPLKFVSADDPPAFFYHGEKDSLVPLLSPQVMVTTLAAVGVKARLHTVPGAGHVQAFFDESAVDAAISFLDEQMKPAAEKKK